VSSGALGRQRMLGDCAARSIVFGSERNGGGFPEPVDPGVRLPGSQDLSNHGSSDAVNPSLGEPWISCSRAAPHLNAVNSELRRHLTDSILSGRALPWETAPNKANRSRVNLRLAPKAAFDQRESFRGKFCKLAVINMWADYNMAWHAVSRLYNRSPAP
jgi:hypothetical protein